ncbi:MAG: MFS transporter [Candidatus Kapabacteria bacterium]|nr:MFS transporter [Candidatus Kapabacteria bacterium]MDW8012958.1 MFS transporter [Bacteroidota bacterium]
MPRLRGVAATARKGTWRFVLLLGLVSLCADATYEGARSIAGQYLSLLGASATAVGIVAGVGEFLGYGLRLFAGVVADRTGQYWAITLLGYAINVFAVPALALVGHWEVAAALLLAERFGKAVRTPSRDALLSYAAPPTGRGIAFGLHEALDQLGALLGPLLIAFVLQMGAGYRWGFAVLGLPAVLTMVALLAAQRHAPEPYREERGYGLAPRSLSRRFWLYVLFAAAAAVGFPHFVLVAYHVKMQGLLAEPAIPLAFSIAMATDAVAALLAGSLYDRVKLQLLFLVPALTVCSAAAVVASEPLGIWVGIGLWGIVLGIQESVMRAAIADVAPNSWRASAYGVFNAAYGAAWMLSSSAMGWLYDRGGIDAIMPLVLAGQAAAVVFLAATVASTRRSGTNGLTRSVS